jgi:hypothetical protein
MGKAFAHLSKKKKNYFSNYALQHQSHTGYAFSGRMSSGQTVFSSA